MTQTLLIVVLFVGAMALLPWLVRRLQQRKASGGVSSGAASKVLSAVAVGQHQRVVTVEVGPEHARTYLVLGVTAQSVNCLHVIPANSSNTPSASLVSTMPFSQEMAHAVESSKQATNG